MVAASMVVPVDLFEVGLARPGFHLQQAIHDPSPRVLAVGVPNVRWYGVEGDYNVMVRHCDA